MADLLIRNATLDDLPGMMEVEKDWPEEQRAPEEKLIARLEKFPEGVFLGLVRESIVGVTTSCLLRFDPEHLEGFTSWDAVTNRGFLFDRESVRGANAIYVVSTGILRASRGQGVFRHLIGAQVELSRRLAMRYCVTGAILEGYAQYEREHPGLSAAEYALMRVEGVSIDPLVEKLRRVGFEVREEKQVIPEYYASEDAHDWSALMVVDNNS